jgi:hypothetical protein
LGCHAEGISLHAPDGQSILVQVDYDKDGRSALYAFSPATIPAPEP